MHIYYDTLFDIFSQLEDQWCESGCKICLVAIWTEVVDVPEIVSVMVNNYLIILVTIIALCLSWGKWCYY